MAKFEPCEDLKVIRQFVKEYKERIARYTTADEKTTHDQPLMFAKRQPEEPGWLQDNRTRFLLDTPNETLVQESYLAEIGYITALAYSPDGSHVVVGHSTGLVQVRLAVSGRVVKTLRHIQFPPRPVYALHCAGIDVYAACTDGVVYRMHTASLTAESSLFQLEQIPHGKYDLDYLNIQFFGESGYTAKPHPFIVSRSAALSLGVSADEQRMAVGYADTSIKIYDMETRETLTSYKVHKLRLNFTAKRMQRMHTGQVCALVCHPDQPAVLASGAWDNTLRVWDTRCKVGCMMTFEGVNICGNSVDLNRDICIAGSWEPLDALSMWDIRARKRISIVNAQNRRSDVDGEYIYACKFWRSSHYNRKGKYAIIGGSGTECLEVINLHNRYIACSFPARGAVLAVDSHGDNIAYGGTAPVFTVASFHDPKHEGEAYESARDEREVPCLELFEQSDTTDTEADTAEEVVGEEEKAQETPQQEASELSVLVLEAT